jgi:Ca2+-binding EF-hand superfamily protein
MQKKTKIAALITLITAGIVTVSAVALAHKGNGEDWKAHRAEMLAKYDTDHDGTLSPTERAAMIHDRATEMFQKLDTNKDGALSPAEFEAGMGLMMEHRGHREGPDKN